MSKQYDKEEYIKKFETDKSHSILLQSAFAQASDIRKFEIELYWKRATYFWALIAVAFAGFFAVASGDFKGGGQSLFLTIIASTGFVFTFAWFSANKGSKYWQENWENHLDLLEDSVTGPLYKSFLERPPESEFCKKYITGPQRYSVSKINQWVAVFTLFIWCVLVIFSLSTYKENCSVGFVFHVLIPITALALCRIMISKGKTHDGSHNPKFWLREVNVTKD
ncbi:TPA: hypothetical protein LEL88_003562 [Vibrio cholerae]|uniref:Uncharacterized protein n=17 Tax=Gammaproteobacteria TaxID=1236 RepID=Q9KM98_VIBCH|nr:hypothetical protein [Vibrio cholerae]EAZ72378.1 hypothetical protein A5C_A0601 [Vibrio cholerae NCTC 8457]EEY49755.1 hypothetical protein VIG_000279 [Vibrio cholerae INDRE 91/1]EYC46362.1 membrane protein [Vibrio cholerae O1 biovar El Tor str. L-3226]MDG6208192.1 hypothetical protein [Vibrio sp. NO3-D2]AAF96387.1 hypothetical protein VC_A0483 [Vibrio cholerae O1 biovar El Tor str. N16961]